MARFLIVEARFYAHLNDMLIAGARGALAAAGHDVEMIAVPGALELPGAIALAAESGRYDGFVALGVVIRGETFHFEIVAGESARGLLALTMDGLAVGNGILTVENEAQALARADPTQGNKGAGAAEAAMALLQLREKIRVTHPSIGGIRLCLGGNTFGWTSDDDETFKVLDAFYAAGGRMVDTAQGYSVWVEGHIGGESETAIGKWLDSRGVRGEMRIATKTGMMGNPGDLKPDKVAGELDKSLERLRTDYVDLYYAHRDDASLPLDEVAEGFDALVKAGKVRELGASNFTAERLAAALDSAESRGLARFGVLQNEYNLVNREQHEGDVRRVCLERDVVGLPYFGLASGFLTGKYRSTEDFAQSVRGSGMDRFFDKGQPVLAVMDAIAAETGASHAGIALAWINAQPGIAAPIAGARVVSQLPALLEGTTLQLSDDQLARLTAAGA